MFDFDLDLDLGSRRQPQEWAVAVHDIEMPHKPPKRRTQRERKQSKRERKAAHAAGIYQPSVQLTPAQAKYRKEFRDPDVVCLSTEIENGNVEYKYNLTGCATNPNRRHQLTTQMKFRLSEGGGECFYYIGVEDDGYPRGLEPKELSASISLLQNMAASLSATARLVEYVPGGFGATAALLHVKANAEEDMRATDLRVAVAGSMDSGKSTLVAVLTHGSDGRPLLDNCRGSARMAVFRHKHEIETGRTSSISQQVLGYDQEGRVLNYVGVAAPTPADITAAAHQLVQFIDMGGHEKYLKTTLYGMTCMLPDYVLLCVDGVCGVTRITREHLAVAVALEVPTALVVTKADAVDSKQLQAVLQQLQQLMEPVLSSGSSHGGVSNGNSPVKAAGSPNVADGDSTGYTGVPAVTSEAQAAHVAAMLSDLHSCTAAGTAASFQQVIFPVFTVSCVTGSGLSLLHAFLSKLRPVSTLRRKDVLHERDGGDAANSSADLAGLQQQGLEEPAAAYQQQVRQQAAAEYAEDGSEQQQQAQLVNMEGSSQLWLPPASAGEVSSIGAAGGKTGTPAAAAGVGVGGVAAGPAGHFQVVHTYDVEGVGWVVSGIAVAGTIEVGQSLLWGPTSDGGFSPVSVSCIQRSHVPVRQVQPGQTATVALQPVGPDGQPLGCSKEALLSAAAAAQAAAEEQAAKEAAAACAAAPTITFGKPYMTPAVVGTAAETGSTEIGGTGRAAAEAGPVPGSVAPDAVIDDSRFDSLADDLAAGLALDGEDCFAATPCGASELDSFDVVFGGGDDDDSIGSQASSGSSRSSFSWSVDLGECSSSSNVRAAGEVDGWQKIEKPAVECSSTASVLRLGNSRKPRRSAAASAASSTASLGSVQAPVAVTPAASNSRARAIPAARPTAAAHDASLSVPLGCSPSSCRSKGSVLLDAAAAPCTYWEFEALLVLLGGHWPARGLVSGCWPPAEPEGTDPVSVDPAAVSAVQGDHQCTADSGEAQEQQQWQQQQEAEGQVVGGVRQRPKKQRSKRYDYAYVIHCNSVRQIARIMHMQELRDPEEDLQQQQQLETVGSGGCCTSNSSESAIYAAQQQRGQQGPAQSSTGGACSAFNRHQRHKLPGGLSASIQAAAALLQDQQQWDSPGCGADTGSSSGGGKAISSKRRRADAASDLGSVVCVRFRFTHRPEWMQVGARLLVRDRSDGHVAAAGFVTQLLEPHTCQQQQQQ